MEAFVSILRQLPWKLGNFHESQFKHLLPKHLFEVTLRENDLNTHSRHDEQSTSDQQRVNHTST